MHSRGVKVGFKQKKTCKKSGPTGKLGGEGRGGGVKKKMLSASFLTPAETKNIGATIRIGQEILCLSYAGFFFKPFLSSNGSYFLTAWSWV